VTKLSLIIPCYNEGSGLTKLVSRIAEIFADLDAEVILVDNGSTDQTAEVMDRETSSYPFIHTHRVNVNQGYGFGILSGFKKAQGDILAWTHADLQTDPADVVSGLEEFNQARDPEQLFVKGARYGRPLSDLIFTWAMSVFERFVLGDWMWDINAQPTMFHRRFYETWHSPPHDSSLDLYAYHEAVRQRMKVSRFPVHFGQRQWGIGENESLRAKLQFSRRIMRYSLSLRRADLPTASSHHPNPQC